MRNFIETTHFETASSNLPSSLSARFAPVFTQCLAWLHLPLLDSCLNSPLNCSCGFIWLCFFSQDLFHGNSTLALTFLFSKQIIPKFSINSADSFWQYPNCFLLSFPAFNQLIYHGGFFWVSIMYLKHTVYLMVYLWIDPPFVSVPLQRLRFSQRGGRGPQQPAGVRRGRAGVRHPAGDPGTRDGRGGWAGQAADGPLPVQILRGLQELSRERQRSD